MKQFDILSFGEPLFEFNQLPTEHSEQHYLSGFGGDTSNFAISAARQGAKVAMLTRLGDDIFGQKFRALWDEERSIINGFARIKWPRRGSILFLTMNKATTLPFIVKALRPLR